MKLDNFFSKSINIASHCCCSIQRLNLLRVSFYDCLLLFIQELTEVEEDGWQTVDAYRKIVKFLSGTIIEGFQPLLDEYVQY